MSITDMKALVGKEGDLVVEGGDLVIEVEVRDVKVSYGHVLYEVTPVSGKGNKWVRADRVRLNG